MLEKRFQSWGGEQSDSHGLEWSYEELRAAIMAASYDTILITDGQGVVLKMSRLAGDQCALSPDELIAAYP